MKPEPLPPSAAKSEMEQPYDSSGRLMLSAYGHKCWDFGYASAKAEIRASEPVQPSAAPALDVETIEAEWQRAKDEDYPHVALFASTHFESLLAEVARLRALQETPVCQRCHGRGWIMGGFQSPIVNGIGSGGSWNEPCPECRKPFEDVSAAMAKEKQ